MPPIACPTCIADAPVEVAWSLFDPARLDEWWDAKTRRVMPKAALTGATDRGRDRTARDVHRHRRRDRGGSGRAPAPHVDPAAIRHHQ